MTSAANAATLTDAVAARIAPSHHHAPTDRRLRRRRPGTADRAMLGLVTELSRTARARDTTH